MPRPVASMTGFGLARRERDGAEARVEIRSVNHRGLKVSVRCRPSLGPGEKELRDRVGAAFERGAVDVYATVRRDEAEAAPVLREALARRATEQLRHVAAELHLEGELGPGDLLRIPDLFRGGEEEILSEAEVRLVLEAADEALAQAGTMRRAEGEATVARLRELIAPIADFVPRARAFAPQVVERVRQRLRQRVEEMLCADLRPADEGAVEREACLYADRADINEELDRLASHLEQYAGILDRGGAAGKRLEFLAQELLREVNTCMSKANDTDIITLGLDAKLAVEQIKEQAANLE